MLSFWLLCLLLWYVPPLPLLLFDPSSPYSWTWLHSLSTLLAITTYCLSLSWHSDYRLLPRPKQEATCPYVVPERRYLQVQRRSQLESCRRIGHCHSYQSPRFDQCNRQDCRHWKPQVLLYVLCLTPTFYPTSEDLHRLGAEADNIDKASWLTSFFICAAVYLALSKISPPTSTFVDRTVESLDDELHSGDHHDHGIQDGHELAAWEKKKSTSNDSASDDKVAPYHGGAPGL